MSVAMLSLYVLNSIKRKAVWGPRRTLAVTALLVLALAPNAFAAARQRAPKAPVQSRHLRQAPKVKPGRPNVNAKAYKLDHELTKRAINAPSSHVSQVFVRLQPNANLPAAYKRYANGPKLRALNAYRLRAA